MTLACRLTAASPNCSVRVMSCGEAGGSAPPGPVERLRAAFGEHAIATGWQWAVHIGQPAPASARPPGTRPAAVRIDLSNEDARELAELLHDSAGRADSQNSGDWIGTTRVARMLDVAPGTIRGWVARNGPKGNPFPQPDRSDPGRSRWPKGTVSKWRARQRRLDRQRRQRRQSR